MKVISKGTGSAWEREYTCTGKGGDEDGCGAKLLVCTKDLFVYGDSELEDGVAHFTCPECHAETEIKFPKSIKNHIQFVNTGD